MLVTSDPDNVVNEWGADFASLNFLGWLGATIIESTPARDVPAYMAAKTA